MDSMELMLMVNTAVVSIIGVVPLQVVWLMLMVCHHHSSVVGLAGTIRQLQLVQTVKGSWMEVTTANTGAAADSTLLAV